jgi:hypothetical protein
MFAQNIGKNLELSLRKLEEHIGFIEYRDSDSRISQSRPATKRSTKRRQKKRAARRPPFPHSGNGVD